jgi:hypothetical protein
MKAWVCILVIGSFLLASTSSRVVAQTGVTVRDLNRIPQKNIQDLIDGGIDLTEQDIRTLVRSPFEGDTVLIHAVLLSDPRDSGLSEVVAGRVSRVHFFVRDVAADSIGPNGMAIQVIDHRWETHDLLQRSVGDVIRLEGVVANFQGGLYVDPIEIEYLGHFEELGLSSSILDPDSTLHTGNINRVFADGTFQANWSLLPDINGGPICLNDASVEHVRTPSPPDRIDWAVTSAGVSRVYTYDLSHRFRNDTRSTYPTSFNLRDDPFEPPPAGAVVSVCGFIVLQAFNDPDGVGRPVTSSTGSMFSLVPIDDSDLIVRTFPPTINHVSRPETVLRSNNAFPVRSTIRADPARTIDSATLSFIIGSDTTQKGMVHQPGRGWVAVIPPTAEDGVFVRYRVKATDSAGLEVSSEEYQYRVLDGGVRSISDIQMTHDGGPGESPFSDRTLQVDITAWVQSSPEHSGMITVQDDSTLAPWSGIMLKHDIGTLSQLVRGDLLSISEATIEEVDGMTILSDLSVERIAGTGPPTDYLGLSTSDLAEPDNGEAFESMLVRIENVSLLEPIDEVTWPAWTGSAAYPIRVSASSPSVSNSVFALWQTRPYIQGVWLESEPHRFLVPETDDDLGMITNVGTTDGHLVSRSFSLDQNYPNPASSTTRISFSVPVGSAISLEIFDVSGRQVRSVHDEVLSTTWNSRSFEVDNLVPGIYLVRLTDGNQTATRKMTVVR